MGITIIKPGIVGSSVQQFVAKNVAKDHYPRRRVADPLGAEVTVGLARELVMQRVTICSALQRLTDRSTSNRAFRVAHQLAQPGRA